MHQASEKQVQEELKPKCHVGFSIIGPSLDFDKISAGLNQKGGQCGRAGSETALGTLPEDVWTISSPIGPLRPLDEHLHWLQTQLQPHVDYLRDLSRAARLRIYIGFTFSQEQNGFAIKPEFVHLFASFNGFIDMYILCNLERDQQD